MLFQLLFYIQQLLLGFWYCDQEDKSFFWDWCILLFRCICCDPHLHLSWNSGLLLHLLLHLQLTFSTFCLKNLQHIWTSQGGQSWQIRVLKENCVFFLSKLCYLPPVIFCLDTHCTGTLNSQSLVGCYFGLSLKITLLPRNFELLGFKMSGFFSLNFSF